MTNSIEDILAVAENPAYVRVATARILLRQDLEAKHAELDAAWQQALLDDGRLNRTPQAPAAEQAVIDCEAEIEAAKVEFRFRSIGSQAWTRLLAAHPPTKEQLKSQPGLDHNPETFPIAAIAAACMSPEMTVEQVERLEAAITNTQFRALWAKCLEANLGGLDTPKSRAGAIRRLRSESADSATGGVSPVPSS